MVHQVQWAGNLSWQEPHRQQTVRGRGPHTVFPFSFFCGLELELGLILIMVSRVRLEP